MLTYYGWGNLEQLMFVWSKQNETIGPQYLLDNIFRFLSAVMPLSLMRRVESSSVPGNLSREYSPSTPTLRTAGKIKDLPFLDPYESRV